MHGFHPIGYKDVLFDVDRPGQSGNCGGIPVRTALEMVELQNTFA